MDAVTSPWVLQQLLVGLAGLTGLMAWRDTHDEPVAIANDVLTSALTDAGLPQKVAAAECEMDPSTFSRRVAEGGAFLARLIDLGLRRPVFGAALVSRMGEALLGDVESPGDVRLERIEQLIRDLDTRLPQRECLRCKQVRRRDSSAA